MLCAVNLVQAILSLQDILLEKTNGLDESDSSERSTEAHCASRVSDL